MTTLVATEPLIRARLEKAHAKNYRGGILGLRAQPVCDGAGFEHKGRPVAVVPCPSVLAIWEAIDAHKADGWTVVLTDVDDDELGDTVLAHLIDGRLLTPDPWDALRSNFSASTIEPALYRSTNDRAVANGLLAVLSAEAYTPAPGGVLTRDHAMSAVARDVLKVVKDPDVEIDTLAILEWSRTDFAAEELAHLQTAGGAVLTEAFGAWLADRAGRLASPVRILLRTGRIADLVPLGVVAGLFVDTDSPSDRTLGVFLGRNGLDELTTDELTAWYADTRSLLTNTLHRREQQIVLDAAAAIIDDLKIADAAAGSELLRHGLDARLLALADAITSAVPHPLPENLDTAVIDAAALQRIEDRWVDVQNHFLAPGDPTCRAFDGALRLARWLAQPIAAATDLASATTDYVRDGSWVDTALVAARRGADNPTAAAALRALIDAAAERRARHDRIFAAALADSPTPAVQTVENVLHDFVIPLAKKTPTLLIVVDALSMAATNDLVTALQRDGWIEFSATADTYRGAALAVLPTLTMRSRCSLLCGELREGPDTVERTGFMSVIRAAQLGPTGGVPDPIFHKKALDAVPSGLALAIDVNNAIADVANQRLVAVVLNYVDDTLHHTDPGGTDWNLETITHLRALLYAAKNAGRAIVTTSDHGHLIEYGNSVKVDRANTYGQRAHGDFANIDPGREIVVEGPRVLTDNNKAVLAVDDTIRYGARNAGYHGGAAPAEVVVPVAMLAAGQLPDGAVPVAAVEPRWWHANPVKSAEQPPIEKKKRPQELSLFDDDTGAEQRNPLPDKVLRSKIFEAQLTIAGRIVVTTPQIKSLLEALLASSSNEITSAQAAAALGVATASVNGALMQAKRVLDVEGYEVLRVDRGIVRLDVAALKEQFGVSE